MLYRLFWKMFNTCSEPQFHWSRISGMSKGEYYLVPIIIAILAEYFM